MALKFPQLRLIIPSLNQGNHGGNDWCGRTSASMIYDYYYAARHGGIEATKSKLIINQRDELPHDLIFQDDEKHDLFCRPSGPAIAALGYRLQQTFEEIKPKGWVREALWAKEKRGGGVSEAKIYELLKPVTDSLEMFNPVLFYSGLSGGTRHIVVISGYRVETDGSLWLHIDDPGQSYKEKKGKPLPLGLASNLKKGGANPTEVLKQEPADTDVDGKPGVRYWLRAAVLFTKNEKTTESDRDYWCDHGFPYNRKRDSPGFTVVYNTVDPEPWSELIDADIEARYPVALPKSGKGADAVADLWEAVGKGGAPYPLGRNRTWHDGIHIPRSAAASDDVLAFGPGELLFARFPEAAEGEEEFGMVVMRHAMNTTTLRFEAPTRDGELPADAAWIYSLYANLSGGLEGAAGLLSRLDPGDEVKSRRFTTAGTPAALLVEVVEDDKNTLTVLPSAGKHTAGADHEEPDLPKAETDETFHVLPVDEELTNLGAWSTRPQAPKAPPGVALGYHPLGAEETIDSAQTVPEADPHTLAVNVEGESADLLPVEEGNEGEGWYAVEPYDTPGFMLSSYRWACHREQQREQLREIAGRKAGALVVKAKTVSVQVAGSDGRDRRYDLKVGGKGSAPVLIECPFDRDQPAFEPNAPSRALAYVRMVPIAPARAVRKGKVPGGWKLQLWDPVTQKRTVLAGTIGASAEVRPSAEGDPPPPGYVALKLEPAIRVNWTYAYAHDADAVGRLAELEDDRFPIVCIAGEKPVLNLHTNQWRRFPAGKPTVELEGPELWFTSEKGAEWVGDRWRCWPRLTPCVQLDEEQAKKARADLKAAYDNNNGDVALRLERGESWLAGVFIADGQWDYEGGVVTPNETAEGQLDLWRFITGSGSGRYFLDSKKGFDSMSDKVNVDPDLALRCVEKFETGSKTKKTRALVELRLAVADKAIEDNEDAVERWKKVKELHDAVTEKITGGELVDLSKLEKDAKISEDDAKADVRLRYREVYAGSLGKMGRMGPGGTGVHFQTFAVDNIVGSGAAAGRWRVVESGDGTPGTSEFFKTEVEAVLGKGRLRTMASESPVGVALKEGRPPRAQEWVDFCRQPGAHRALSRVIAAHESEWTLDWNEVADNAPKGEGIKPRVEKLPELARTPALKDVKLTGAEDATTFHFFHPLRLIEWLTTGIELSLHDVPFADLANYKPTLKMGQDLALTPVDANSRKVFRLRTVLGDPGVAKPKRERDGLLDLDGLDSENDRIKVQMQRGEIRRLWFTQPGGGTFLKQEPIGSDLTFRTRDAMKKTREKYVDEIHLLADANEKLAETGVSYATFAVTVRYNIACPDLLEFELNGDGFVIEDVEVTGAVFSGGNWSAGSSHSVELLPPIEPPPYPVSSSVVEVRIRVMALGEVDKEATLVVAVSGGDLAEAVEGQLTLKSREFVRGDFGEDVAKILLYLSQIVVGTARCYTKQNDGAYGGGGAAALWRFILFFSPTDDWPEELTTIATNNGDVELDGISRIGDRLEVEVKRLLNEKKSPNVSAALQAEIVKRYAMPHAPPKVELDVTRLGLEDPPEEAKSKWDGWNAAERTAVLPYAEQPSEIEIAVRLASSPGGSAATVKTKVELLTADAYAFIGTPGTNLAALLNDGIKLRPTGKLNAAGAKPSLKITGPDGLVMATMQLGGAVDLTTGSQKGAGPALLQGWLKAYPAADGKPYYGGKVDGSWGKGSRKALAKFKSAVASEASYAQLVVLAAAGPAEPAAEAAE